MAKIVTSAATMVEPTGVPANMEITIPDSAHITDNTEEQIVTLLKLLNNRMEDRAGKMIRADISRDPTRFIASTMITAIMIAIIRL